MTNIELIKQLGARLKKFSWLIIIIALVCGVLYYFIAKQNVILYTAKSTVFPLNGASDNSISSSAISSILGLSDAPKSFSQEAAINIVELATSRRTKEAVAATRIPSQKNRTIAELLIDENNSHTGFMQNSLIKKPADSAALLNKGTNILNFNFTAKINKNGILELYFTNSNTELVREVSYVFIDRISNFYIDLKKKKAQIDYEFSVKKSDSLLNELKKLDKQAIQLDETTYFTNDGLKRFSLPKINLAQDKQTVQSQYYYAVNNREAAAYRLQKETPIIETLDRPEGPYDSATKSAKLYAIIGVLLGFFIGILLVSWKVLSKYFSKELGKAIEKALTPKEEEVTG
jgi:uncharacterized protein involved in exopolysaccharide biosynthesis